MKLFTHPTAPKYDRDPFRTAPLSIFLNRTTELRIEPGDRLDRVARAVARLWPAVGQRAGKLTAYYFALGERLAGNGKTGPWTSHELRDAPDRRYLLPRQPGHQSAGRKSLRTIKPWLGR